MGAQQTPLTDLLRSVPEDACANYRHNKFLSQHIPYGRMCQEAADEIERLRAENERLKSLLTEARENVDSDVRELEAMYAGYPAIMDLKTAADRYLRNRIDAALAAKGE